MFKTSVLALAAFVLLSSSAIAQQMQFDKWDANSDGKLTREELPSRLRANFNRVDRDKDGLISRAEDMAFRRRAVRKSLPAGTEVRRDVAYVEDGHERQKLDLYLLPKTETPRPLVAWIHGGAWRQGSKENCPAVFLLQHGYNVASINYRLSQHAIFPAQIHDCKAAIHWLRTHADELNIDADRIGVWGSSAGGHLVALLGTSGDVTELAGNANVLGDEKVSSRVQAVVDYYGPTDLLKMNAQAGKLGSMDHDAPDSPESKLLGGTLQEQVAEAKQASPLTYISDDNPPFLIVHGDQDPLVSVQQSKDLHQLLTRANVDSTLVIVKGGKHGAFREPERLEQMRKFFDRVLKMERR